jgi:Ca-activated chloride channel family protein
MGMKMNGKAVGTDFKGAVTDFVELVAKALLSGIGVGVAMAIAILALSSAAQAASVNDAKTGTLLLHTPQGKTAAPKVSTEVAIEVTGMIARTRVTQVFHNPGAEYVEGIYVFPLPEKAAVDHLWMKIGERVIEGRIKEKAEARRAYEQARSEGKKAAIVEQQRPNLFTNSVAHIGPDERIEVKIEYQQSLAYENGEYRLRFPLAVTPRYDPLPGPLPGEREVPDEPKALEARGLQPVLHPEYEAPGCGGANPVDIVVTIDAGVAIAQVASSYHDASIQKSAGHRVTVMLVKEQEDADRDFELTWKVAPAAAPQAALFMQRNAGTDYALLMVVPPQPTATERAAFQRMPREMVLIVDTSGSMQGASIIQARQALEHALGTLTERDRFNVVEFNSILRPMWPATLAATPQNVDHARKWVRQLQASGGTEMAPALAFALDGRETPGMLRQVVFITDGAVGNEEALFRLISERLGGSRLFTVGIGSAPNSHFMTRAAQFGRGTFTHIGDVREVNEKMSRLFAKIEAPVLRDVVDPLARRHAGRDLPRARARPLPRRAGDGRPPRRAPLGTVVVSGTRGNQPWSVALTPSADSAAGVGALWARAKIARSRTRSRAARPGAIRPQVVKVALEHHLVSAYTSLVAVDVTPTAPGRWPEERDGAASLPRDTRTHLPQTDTPPRCS